MRPRAAGADQLVAHAPREGQVGDPVTVQMAELAAPDLELDAAKAMLSATLDARPRGDVVSAIWAPGPRCSSVLG